MYQALSAGDLCTRSTVIADKAMALNEAARLMREHHVGCLVVVDETDRGRLVAGVLTDRDIVTAVVARDMDARVLRVEDVMSTDLVTAREGDSVMEVLADMRRKGVRRVPVTDAQGALVGVLALDDLLEVVAEELQSLVQAIASGRRRELRLRP
jgi:CBS domain-containing protein